MADLKPVGINLVTGQATYAAADDVLRPDEGDITISGGSTQLDGTVLTLKGGDANTTIDSEGGSVFVVAPAGNDNANGGRIELTCGDSGTASGNGGYFQLTGGDGIGATGSGGGFDFLAGDASTAGSGGGFNFAAGDSGGIASGGGFIFTPGTGYDHGEINMQVQGYSTTSSGGVVRIKGGADGTSGNYAVNIETHGQTSVPGKGSSSILLQTGTGDGAVCGNVDIETGGSIGSTGGNINIGSISTTTVTIGAQSDPTQVVNIYNFFTPNVTANQVNIGTGDGDTGGLILLKPGYQTFGEFTGTVLNVGPLFTIQTMVNSLESELLSTWMEMELLTL